MSISSSKISNCSHNIKGVQNQGKDFYIPKHNYNTRYSSNLEHKRRSISKLTHITALTYPIEKDISNSEYSDNESNSDTSFNLPNCNNDLTIYQKEKLNMRVREYPNPSCGPPYACPNNKWSRIVSVFISIGILVLTMVYLNEQYNKSCNSMSLVCDEIKNIKKQVDCMKTDVNNVVKIRDETERKLDKIEDILKNMKDSQDCASSTPPCAQEPVKSCIKEMLHEYDADKTGKTDFALESAGGSIVCTKETENFLGASNTLMLFGVPLCENDNSPRAMIQPGMAPGQCWAFKGNRGCVLIKLLAAVKVNGVSLEHISKTISPTGEISTAPKDFSIWGVSCPDYKDEQLLGKFTYDINGPSLQHFEIACSSRPYQYIQFKVHSNHGNAEFTCVYRLRVHGTL